MLRNYAWGTRMTQRAPPRSPATDNIGRLIEPRPKGLARHRSEDGVSTRRYLQAAAPGLGGDPPGSRDTKLLDTGFGLQCSASFLRSNSSPVQGRYKRGIEGNEISNSYADYGFLVRRIRGSGVHPYAANQCLAHRRAAQPGRGAEPGSVDPRTNALEDRAGDRGRAGSATPPKSVAGYGIAETTDTGQPEELAPLPRTRGRYRRRSFRACVAGGRSMSGTDDNQVDDTRPERRCRSMATGLTQRC